jgi:hypothetical protein
MALGLDRVGSALWPDVTSMQSNGGFIFEVASGVHFNSD